MRKFLAFILIVAVFVGMFQLGSGGIGSAVTTALTPLPTGSPRPEDNPVVNLIADAIRADEAAKAAQQDAAQKAAIATNAWQSTITEQARRDQESTTQASATQAEQTRVVDATSTQAMWQIISWTATSDSAEATSTVEAARTATVEARANQAKTETRQATIDAAADQKRIEEEAYQAQLRANDLRQRQLTSTLQALWPYIVAGVPMTLIAVYLAIYLWMMRRTIISKLRDRFADKQGRYPLTVNEQGQVYNPNRDPYPNGEPGRYQYADLTPAQQAMQTQVNAGLVVIEVARTSEPGKPADVQAAAQQASNQQALPGGVNFLIADPQEQQNYIPGHVGEILDTEWKEATRANSDHPTQDAQ